MNQTRLGSFIESLMNIVIGFVVALISQTIIFPMFDIYVSMTTHLAISAWFTAISLVRSYIIRRWFNARLRATAQKLAGVTA